MKILFLMRHALYLRNYEHLVCDLAKQGHQVHLGFTVKRKHVDDTLATRLAEEHRNITFDYPEPIKHSWASFATRIRTMRNYFRYFEPRLRKCKSLMERAERRVPTGLVKFFNVWPTGMAYAFHKQADKFLAFLEEVVPVPQQAADYLNDFRPHMLLVTPLIDLESEEIDYVKAARALNFPSVLCVASWDNLTNKGIIQGKPDFVVLWNQLQKREAIELHKFVSKRIYLTGAQLFDQWFVRKPTVDRREFCERLKLDPEQKIITYLCSSVFISRNEVDFVNDWARQLRASSDPTVAKASILVRPHPASGPKYWTNVDPRIEEIDNLEVWPKGGQVPTDDFSKDSYFNTLYFSDAVVGINTSAFIEAGIVGTPCFTIREDRYAATQDGTVHFHYLTDGGLVNSASSLADHSQQLTDVFQNPAPFLARAKEFTENFVRPHGLEKPAGEVILKTIADIIPNEFGTLKRLRTKDNPKSVLVTRRFLNRWIARKDPTTNAQQSWAAIKQDDLRRKKYDDDKRPKSRMGKVRMAMDKRQDILRGIRKIAEDDRPVIIGPWFSEVGYELLYWIPFLNWIRDRYEIDPKRCVVISRGGCAPWYGNLADRYFELLEAYEPKEFFERNEARMKDLGGSRKHLETSALDDEVLKKCRAKFDLGKCHNLHPYFMYRLFREFFAHHLGHRVVEKHTVYEPLPCANESILADLGLKAGEYTAVKFYYSAHFPHSEDTQRHITELIAKLSRKGKVAILDTGFQIDDHEDIEGFDRSQLVTTASLSKPQNNLAVQSAVVAGARSFYGTYGGFSYLAPLNGVNSYNYYCHSYRLISAHLHVAHRVFMGPPFGRFVPCHLDSWREVEQTLTAQLAGR